MRGFVDGMLSLLFVIWFIAALVAAIDGVVAGDYPRATFYLVVALFIWQVAPHAGTKRRP